MSNHRAYQLYAHLTWHTWKRVGCVDQATVEDVRRAVAHACRETGVHLLRGAILADHVHLVVSYRPSTRLSDFIRLAKCVAALRERKSTRLNSSHSQISYAVFCLKKKKHIHHLTLHHVAV